MFLRTAARDANETRPERLLRRRDEMSSPSESASSKAKTLERPISIRYQYMSPNPNEFARFAFNLLMRPMTDATTSSVIPAVSFHTVPPGDGLLALSDPQRRKAGRGDERDRAQQAILGGIGVRVHWRRARRVGERFRDEYLADRRLEQRPRGGHLAANVDAFRIERAHHRGEPAPDLPVRFQ